MNKETIQDTEAQDDSNEKDFTRRGFVKYAAVGLCGVYAVAIGYPVYKYLHSPVDAAIAEAAANSVTLPNADKLPLSSTLAFAFKGNPAMLIHFGDGTWVALSAVCTHLGCTLGYQPPAPLIVCPCHGGQYDPHTGKNVGGPPPHPLTKFEVQAEAGKVIVTDTGAANA